LLASWLSIEALGDWIVDREARAPKLRSAWPGEQPVAKEVENLKFFSHLTPEALIDCILGPFE
jgi:hypothetical protein